MADSKLRSVDVGGGIIPGARVHPASASTETLILALILCLGAVLLLPRLGQQSLWLDEGGTVGPVLEARSVGDVITGTLEVDAQPPGSHLFLYAAEKVLPATEFGLRLPSFVAIEIALILLYLAVRTLWGGATALIAVGIAQVSPFLCFYAAEARNYGLWFLLITASLLLFVRWLTVRDSEDSGRVWRLSVALGVVNGLGLWVHVFHVFLIAGELACAAAVLFAERGDRRWRRRSLASAAVAQGLAVLLFVPWLVLLASRVREGTAGVPWTRKLSPGVLAYCAFGALFGGSFGPTLRELHVDSIGQLVRAHWFSLALASAALGAVVLCYLVEVRDSLRDRARRWELVPLLLFPAIILPGPLVYAAAIDFPLHPRHLFFAWPLLPLVLALAWKRGGSTRVLVAVIVALQMFALWNLLFNEDYAKDDQRAAVEFVDRRATEKTYVLSEGFVAEYYARRVIGRDRRLVDFPSDTRDVWLVDNREWEPQNQVTRNQLEQRMAALGFTYEGTYDQFRGIALRHWTRPGAAQ